MLDLGVCTEDDVSQWDKQIKEQVDAAVKFSLETPFPKKEELYTDIMDKPIAVRGRSVKEGFVPGKQ